jgi:hypothetical protein
VSPEKILREEIQPDQEPATSSQPEKKTALKSCLISRRLKAVRRTKSDAHYFSAQAQEGVDKPSTSSDTLYTRPRQKRDDCHLCTTKEMTEGNCFH